MMMKSVLVFANDEGGMSSRLDAALAVARTFGGHISCLQATPFDAFIVGDPFGGIYAAPELLAKIREDEEGHQARIEADFASDGVSWDWLRLDGDAAHSLVNRSGLADLVVLSLPARRNAGARGEAALLADVALHARTPVLAVPQDSGPFDPLGNAVVAWNGSMESSHALRASLPMLAMAAVVHIVTVGDDEARFPAIDACQYLDRHGVRSELHEWPRKDRSVSNAILDAAVSLGGGYIVMGAYGHSRVRKTVLGGVTRDLLGGSTLPLLLTH